MKILIADSDRDLLRSYQKLLQLEKYDVSTLFDGTQVILNLSKQQFDLVILNMNIPRINYREIVKMLNDRNSPVVVLLNKKITSGMLIDDVLANSYLSFPFL
ncbi:MAG: response regulator, partial [Lachnospiraceae bacterium]|nr:response regulator [Lachnospiraceae bacterium]